MTHNLPIHISLSEQEWIFVSIVDISRWAVDQRATYSSGSVGMLNRVKIMSCKGSDDGADNVEAKSVS